MYAYLGRILTVDLNTGIIGEEPLAEDMLRQFIGGSGVGCRLLYDHLGPDTDPLGPENPLLFMAGPLVGTPAPSCGRYVVCARSPLTGLWGEANSGGFWGPELRFAGYDGILITGKAATPVYLWVRDGEAELRDAAHLWGLDTYQTQRQVKEEAGDERTRVCCIGPAGEQGVLYAAVMNDHGRAAGRTGMGTVMGAKNLKAIAVRGSGQIPLADSDRFREVTRDILELFKDDFVAEALRSLGTANVVDFASVIGDMPNKYWTRGVFAGAERISGATMSETILTGNTACYRCPIACGRRTTLQDTPYGLREVDGPEYETIAAFGSLLLIDDLPGITYINHLCNAYGLDTISTGSSIAFATYLFEQGIIGPQDTGGLELRWGDVETTARLVEMTARREGFGAVLSEGTRRMGERFGVPELAVQVNGLEVPFHDPRASVGMALTYIFSPRGACHNQGDMYLVDQGQEEPELGILMGDPHESSAEKAQVAARCMDWRTLYGALIMCVFANPGAERVRDLVNAATGWEMSVEDLQQVGERIFNLKRLLNLRLGLDPARETLPRLLRQPLPEGGAAGIVPDVELLRREYYRARGWDVETGRPTDEKLEALKINL